MPAKIKKIKGGYKMSNANGMEIPIVEDDMGEGFKETWKDYNETMRTFNPFDTMLENKEHPEIEDVKNVEWEKPLKEKIKELKKQLDNLKEA